MTENKLAGEDLANKLMWSLVIVLFLFGLAYLKGWI